MGDTVFIEFGNRILQVDADKASKVLKRLDEYTRYRQKIVFLNKDPQLKFEVEQTGDIRLVQANKLSSEQYVKIPRFCNCIGQQPFKECSFTEIEIDNPDDEDYIMDQLFSGMQQDKLKVQIANPERVVQMDGTFSSCDRIKTLELVNFDTTRLKSARQLFAQQYNLRKVKGYLNTQNVIHADQMFQGCSRVDELLGSLRNNKIDFDSVETAQFMFQGVASSIQLYGLILDLTPFKFKNLKDAQYMFLHSRTKYIMFKEFQPSSAWTAYSMFTCSDITTFRLSEDTFNTSQAKNLSQMFYDQRLVELQIYDNMLDSVESYANMLLGTKARVVISNQEFKKHREMFRSNGAWRQGETHKVIIKKAQRKLE